MDYLHIFTHIEILAAAAHDDIINTPEIRTRIDGTCFDKFYEDLSNLEKDIIVGRFVRLGAETEK
jgi:hypothetical protein